MARFVKTSTDSYYNLDYVTNIYVSGSNVVLVWDESAVGSSGSASIACSDSTQASAVAKAVAIASIRRLNHG